MKLAFITNFYNHHQKPLADALYSLIGDEYYFIETTPISEERLKMGWGREEKPSYVLQNYTDQAMRDQCQQIIDTADVVILGNAPYSLVRTRALKKKVTFLYTERLYKTGVPFLKLPVHFLRNFKNYIRFKNFYVLCASAYVPLDFSRTLSFINKTYKWGYFTELKKHDNVDQLIKTKQSASILWVSRYIPLKHPEHVVEVAKRLKSEGIQFQLKMIGSGELEDQVRSMIQSNDLSDCVEMLGVMSPEQVREHMEKSEIFLFTSDRNEGWGAVMNESMNSACAVVANSAIGSVPFLLNDDHNGCMYKDGNVDDLYSKVKELLQNSNKRQQLAKNAYKTMIDEWNAENAAEKFLTLTKSILDGHSNVFPYKDGVCSKAKILKDGWKK